jgi:hypothetical protein
MASTPNSPPPPAPDQVTPLPATVFIPEKRGGASGNGNGSTGR